jgi:hypothetical protein
MDLTCFNRIMEMGKWKEGMVRRVAAAPDQTCGCMHQ